MLLAGPQLRPRFARFTSNSSVACSLSHGHEVATGARPAYAGCSYSPGPSLRVSGLPERNEGSGMS
jgi:hypothetical protein